MTDREGPGASRFRKAFLCSWSLLILVPFLHTTTLRFPGSHRLAEIFRPNLSHVAAHLCLFGVFAWLLAGVLERAGWRRGSLGVLVPLAALLLGVLQEGLQAVAVGSFLGPDQILDLAVDLIGGMTGLVLYGLWSSGRMRRLWSTTH